MKNDVHLLSFLAQSFWEWEMFQIDFWEKIKSRILCSITLFFFLENPAIYEIMWENIVEPDRPQMTVCHVLIACRIPKNTNTHFHCNNCCTKAPQCYVTRTLHVSLLNRSGENLRYDLWTLKTVQLIWIKYLSPMTSVYIIKLHNTFLHLLFLE